MSRSIPGTVSAKPPPLSGWRCERQAVVKKPTWPKIIALDPIMKIITGKPENIELVLTGRNAPEEILECADLVTEMKEIKQP